MKIERFTLGDIRSNCYIISEKGHAIVVDPGFDSDKVKAYLTTNDLTIDVIYATHGHFDHIGGINALKDLYPNALVVAPLNDRVFFDHTQGISRLPYTVHVDYYVKPDETYSIKLGDTTFYVIHTPGHSPGGTCLYSQGILISGDTLFRETVGRTDLYMSSFEQIKDSILRKLYILPEDTVCYPGHGLTTTIGHEMRYNAFVRK